MRAALLPALSALVACACAGAARAPTPPPARVERHLAVMGTAVVVEVAAADRATTLRASERAVRALEAAEARLSTWRDDSELARLNAAPAGQPVEIGATLAAELEAARRWWRETDGAFDPGVGALVRAWGLRSGGREPDADELARAMAPGGLASLELDGTRATRRDAGLVLEEGGFGKGAGLDAAIAAARDAGAVEVRLDLGGQLAVHGTGRARFAVAHPDERDVPVLAIAVERGSLATSGNSERGVVVGGRRIGHLLDPRTGHPAPDFGSLTVWAPTGLAADCLSTGLYVLGPERALEWAAQRDGVEVVVLEPLVPGLRCRATAGLRGRLEPLVPGLEIRFLDPDPRRPR